jgi:hypothetical protein
VPAANAAAAAGDSADTRTPHLSLSSLMAEALWPVDNSLGQKVKQDPTLRPQQPPHADAALPMLARGVPKQPLQPAEAAVGSASRAAAVEATPQLPQKRPKSGRRKAAQAALPARNDRPKRV